jgi:hypothetical protein
MRYGVNFSKILRNSSQVTTVGVLLGRALALAVRRPRDNTTCHKRNKPIDDLAQLLSLGGEVLLDCMILLMSKCM